MKNQLTKLNKNDIIYTEIKNYSFLPKNKKGAYIKCK